MTIKDIVTMSDTELMGALETHANLQDERTRYTATEELMIENELEKRGYSWKKEVKLTFFKAEMVKLDSRDKGAI